MARKKTRQTLEEMVQEKLELSRIKPENPHFEPPSSLELSAREQFSLFWASERKKYNRSKDLEEVLWLHLQAIEHDKPELFEAGIENFGLKKILQ